VGNRKNALAFPVASGTIRGRISQRDRAAQSATAAKIIDRYTKQMTTTQGVTALLKNPILEYISTKGLSVSQLRETFEEYLS